MNEPAKITIALDAHGTDHNIKVIIDGAKRAVQELGVNVILVGDKEEIVLNLGPLGWIDGLTHETATEVISMKDEPAWAVRTKTDSSIVVGARLVKEGKADVLVGAGNTGAMMAASLLTLGRIPGVSRPGIAVELPAPASTDAAAAGQILMDGGATVQSEPKWLFQHALMAKAYVENRLGIENPTIGLLSNGEEASKGDDLRKKAHELLKDLPGFVGNCEGRDLTSGNPTIVITDGFTGNVALKTIEGVAKSISQMVINVLSADEFKDIAPQLLPSLMNAAKSIHPDTYGGAVLLGVNNPVVIAHGSASSNGIFNAIRVGVQCVENNVVQAIAQAIDNASISQ